MGLKLTAASGPFPKASPFSRTPRGFEADLSEDKQDELRALSAEPLVGLKLVGVGVVCLMRPFQPNPSWV